MLTESFLHRAPAIPLVLARLLTLAAITTSASAREIAVADADEIADAMQSAQPGDVLVMADGVWTNQAIVFAGHGSAEAPITLRAQTPGGVKITGASNLSISGSYLVADGLNFEDGTPGNLSHVVQFRGPFGDAIHSRLTNSQIINYNPEAIETRYFWVSLYGQDNRVDHNRFQAQNHSGVTVVVWLDGVNPARHQVDANHFVDRAEGTGNGFETIRLGTSEVGDTNAFVTVENNLFERTDGEIEIISNKSNDNTFRYNTIRESAGTITLRHGHRATVEGNFILGDGKADSGGVRVIGEDHRIVNNYIADIDDRADGAISITAGIPDTEPSGYQQVKNALIANNTIVNVEGAAISLDWGYGQRDRTLLAENVTVANNLLWSTHAPIFEGQEGQGWTWQNNLAYGSELGIADRGGIVIADPMLAKDADGLWRPTASSPTIDGGIVVAGLTDDMDGQARVGLFDIGADEFLTAQIVRKPLTSNDVGPSWTTYTPGPPPPDPTAGEYVAIQAESFTRITDPDGDGDVWSVVDDPDALGGQALSAPDGSRTDLASDPHDTLALYDLTFGAAGTYTAYYRARGFDGASDSFFTPEDFGVDPAITENVSSNGTFAWEVGGTFEVSETHVGMPLELRLGRREGLTQLDAIVLHASSHLTARDLDALFDQTALLGDMDMDGRLTLDDITAFVLALVSPSSYAAQFQASPLSHGDINRDGRFNFDDISPFAELFGTTQQAILDGTAVPEPASLSSIMGALVLLGRHKHGESPGH